MNSTITFSTTTPNTTAVARQHRLNTVGHYHHRWGPARFRSLDFGECSGYLKGPARFCSLDFGERNGYLKGLARFCSLDFGKCNGYLKGVAPIDAQ